MQRSAGNCSSLRQGPACCKPKEVRENGYRYYSLRQLYLFDVIRFFSDTGMSMKEIKQYLDNRTTQLFLSCAQESIEKMERQRDVLGPRASP